MIHLRLPHHDRNYQVVFSSPSIRSPLFFTFALYSNPSFSVSECLLPILSSQRLVPHSKSAEETTGRVGRRGKRNGGKKENRPQTAQTKARGSEKKLAKVERKQSCAVVSFGKRREGKAGSKIKSVRAMADGERGDRNSKIKEGEKKNQDRVWRSEGSKQGGG